MGAVLLAAGRQGQALSALPHSRIMIHQPLGGVAGPGHRHRDPRQGDPADQARQLNELLRSTPASRSSGSSKDTERDYFMGAGEAKEYGIIDEVLIQKKAATPVKG